MCHDFLEDASFYQTLYDIDHRIALEVQSRGCPRCGGVLHVANYRRKPRGFFLFRDTDRFSTRLSLCCAEEGCRRRCTPPSVRFLGRKVYLGLWVILSTAITGGLEAESRCRWIERLDLWPQTLSRWRRWWRTEVADSTVCRSWRGRFVPELDTSNLPGTLLKRLTGSTLRSRLLHCLQLLMPVGSRDYPPSLRFAVLTQRM